MCLSDLQRLEAVSGLVNFTDEWIVHIHAHHLLLEISFCFPWVQLEMFYKTWKPSWTTNGMQQQPLKFLLLLHCQVLHPNGINRAKRGEIPWDTDVEWRFCLTTNIWSNKHLTNIQNLTFQEFWIEPAINSMMLHTSSSMSGSLEDWLAAWHCQANFLP